jgi:hydrogenase maturation protease
MPSVEIDAPVLVVGYGNVLRGDDGAGPAAAKALRNRLPRRIADVLVVHQLLPELAERLSRCVLAIFIDADAQTPPGQIREQNVAIHQEGGQSIGHYQSPEQLLAMAKELYGRAPRAILFNVGAADFIFRHGLSEPVRTAIPRLVIDVIDTVNEAADAWEQRHA